jgi:hypothetical protein
MGFRALAVVASVALALTAAASMGQAQAATTAGIPLTWPGGDFVATYDYTYMSPATVEDFVDNQWPETVGLSPNPSLSDLFQATWQMVYGHTTTPPPQPPTFTGGTVTESADGTGGTMVTFDIPAADFQALTSIPDSLNNFLIGVASGVAGGFAGIVIYGICGSKFFPGGKPADATKTALQICNALSTGVAVGAVGAAMTSKLNTGETSGFPVGGFLGAVASGAASAYLTGTSLMPMVPEAFFEAFRYLGSSGTWTRLLAFLPRYMSAADANDVDLEMQELSNTVYNDIASSWGETLQLGQWASAFSQSTQGTIPNVAQGSTSTSSTNCMDAYGSTGDAWPTPGAVPGQPVAINTCDGSPSQSWIMWGNGSISVWGLCLDANGGSLVTVSGSQWAQATLQYCDGSASQVWYQYGGQLVNGSTQYCLDDPASNTAPGTQLILHPCQGNPNQKWALPSAGQYASAFGAVKNPTGSTKYCMDAYGAIVGASPGQKVAINSCGGTQAQSWTVGTNSTVQAWGLCLDAAGGGTDSSGDPLATLQLCDGSSSQAWTVAGKELVNSGDSECLDDPGSNTTAGTQLILFQCKGGTNQFWVLPGSDPSSSSTTTTWTGGQVIADPAYIDPTSDMADWNTLIGSPTAKLGVVVANVLNGPGSTAVAGWTTAIDGAHASGKKILGYVDTGYLGLTGRTTRLGSTAMADWVAQIEQDINAWYNLYGSSIDGIFFDDGYNACGADNEYPAVYHAVNQYEKVNHPGAMTVLNPGTAVPQCYEGTADVLLTFEGSEATYESSAYQPLGWTPKSPSEIWHIIYGVTAAEVSLVDETSQTRGAGYVYMTDDVPANPYDTIPSFWSAEEADVPGGTPGVSAATPYTTGGALPGAPSGLSVTSSDYTSAALTWTAGANVANYLVYLNGQEVASLPSSMTATTIGGLTPGGTAYTLNVVAQGAGGDLSAVSNSVGVTTLALPGRKAIANPIVAAGASTVSVSADFYVPYSFRRVYFSPPSTSTESCWWMADDNPIGDPLCARWLIENTTLLVYAGSGGDWTWTPVAYIPPTINGYTYTWTIPEADLGDYTGYIGFEGQGYGPFTDIYTAECADCQ